ncbi:MAG TPA: biotin/lipoyl-containing protein [Ktedonosporobacter sp.]|jgi:acetyl-CoA carboxylase biotin carboxyl carrier protein|nr:biotin/lipoyl-containing protein [Ktedonosporobacter sp.]
MSIQKSAPWLERVEELISILEGSTIGELELIEGGTEIVIRRNPGIVITAAAEQLMTVGITGSEMPTARKGRPEPQGVPIIAPLTGVYYAAASPSTPPFVNIGDVVQTGQVVALIESMKVFNEVMAEVTGRVIALVGKNGDVVQKGDVLLRVEPV